MPQIIKPKVVKKTTKPTKKPVSRASTKVKNPKAQKSKNPVAYFECMSACCQKGIKPKKITEVARECKHNALAINAKMSAQKTKAVQKIKEGYETLGKGLGDLLKASK